MIPVLDMSQYPWGPPAKTGGPRSLRSFVVAVIAPKKANGVSLSKPAKAIPQRGFLTGRLGSAVTSLRRRGYTPVYAQRSSELSTDETGLWVVGRKVLTVDEVIALADRN